MQPIGMPAWRPTADSIWNIFRISGKRHLLITGQRGSGKSTLLSALTEDRFPGLTSWAVPGEAVFLRENGTANQARIGIYDMRASGTQNKMQPLFFGFAALGIPALKRCMECPSEWISIDEIGYLEATCPEYCQLLQNLMQGKRLAAAIRKQELPFLTALIQREDVFLLDLDQPFPDMGCVIMASGLGKRFGGSKLLAPFGGRPMLDWVLDATEGVFSSRVVVTRSEEAAAHCRTRGAETVLHALPHRSDTVRLGLEACEGVTHCLFCQADQPLLTSETLRLLALAGRNTPEAIWRPRCGGQPCAPMLFPKWTFPELAALPEGKGGGYVAKVHPESVRYLDIDDPIQFQDIDTREDLHLLETKITPDGQ